MIRRILVSLTRKCFQTKLVPFKLVFNNPSLGQISKSSFNSKKKPMLNKKDVVDPKVESKNALKKDIKWRQNSRFLENSKKSVSQTANSSTKSHNTFVPIKILKRLFNPPNQLEHKQVVNPTLKMPIADTQSVITNSPRTVSSVFKAKSDGMIFNPQQFSKPNVSSNKERVFKKTVSQKSSKQNLVWKIKNPIN